MSKLISGKEAFMAHLDGESVQWRDRNYDWNDWSEHTSWCSEALLSSHYQFRLKPRTITINGIEVPAPFEPESDQEYWILSESYYSNDGYKLMLPDRQQPKIAYGAWRTEEEIKQVVAALRSVFK